MFLACSPTLSSPLPIIQEIVLEGIRSIRSLASLANAHVILRRPVSMNPPAYPFPLQHSSYFPSDRQFPLYSHSEFQHSPRRTRRHQSYTARTLPPRYNDIKAVERHRPLKHRRSSFALSNAFERDSGVEVVISPVLPSMSSATSILSVKLRMKAVLSDLVHNVKPRWHRSMPDLHISEPEN